MWGRLLLICIFQSFRPRFGYVFAYMFYQFFLSLYAVCCLSFFLKQYGLLLRVPISFFAWTVVDQPFLACSLFLASDAGEPAKGSEVPSPPGDDQTHAASQTPTLESTHVTSPSVLSPSITLTETNDTSSDSGISSPSKISPSYTTTKDSRVYRNVAPKITFTGQRNTHVVNSALSNARDPSSPSSPTWKCPSFSHSPRSHSPVCQSPSLPKSAEDEHDSGSDSPRLMKIIRQESTSPQNTERRYEGAHIPSRVFRHLQTEYPASSGENNELQEPKSRVNSKSPSPRYDGSPIPPRVFKSLQNETNSSFDSDTTDGDTPSRASSSFAELEEYYHNGVANTPNAKDTVLKELTTQFDNTGIKKKPRAAPGKVFRYLQTQYDNTADPQPESQPDQLQTPSDEGSSFGYKGSKVPSPSFRFLQNQYHQQPDEEIPKDSDPLTPDAPTHEVEPTPYRGGRLPGKTFRFLQDNITTHPSVLQAKK